MLVGQFGGCTSSPAASSQFFWLQRTQTQRSLVQGDGLAQWHFQQPSQSFLTNEYVSVWPKRACVIFPSFYHKDAGRHSHGIRSTLCRERQTGSANKMECLCISHLSVNIQILLPTGTACCTRGARGAALAWYPILLVLVTIHWVLLTPWSSSSSQSTPLGGGVCLHHNRSLVAASPMVSLACCVRGNLFYGGGTGGWWTLISPTFAHMHYSIVEEVFWLKKAREEKCDCFICRLHMKWFAANHAIYKFTAESLLSLCADHLLDYSYYNNGLISFLLQYQ